MNTLQSIVRNIALLVLISSFWELLAPAGSLRGPVRLVTGLLVVACVALPLSDALAKGPASWELTLPATADPTQTLSEGEALAARFGEAARSQYELDMAREISSLALLAEGVREARAAVSADAASGALKQVQLELTLAAGAEQELVKSKVINLIGTFFAISEENINCRIKEVEEDAGADHGEQPAPEG